MAGPAGDPPLRAGAVDRVLINAVLINAVLRGARGIRWWVASVMGDNAYARYTDHLARTHPGEPVLTEREYWRQRYAEADANPAARCC